MFGYRCVRGIAGSVVAALLGLALSVGPVAPASADPPRARGLGTERPIGPAPVFSALAHGSITMASNSVVTCQTPPCSESASNGSSVKYVKTDPSAPGRTASAATLTLPAGAKVLNARLYWQLNPVSTSGGMSGDAALANQVSIKAPGATTYTRLTADTYDWFDALGGGTPTLTAHAGAKDVTDLVTAAGAGSYTVADIQACSGQSVSSGNLGCWGGWSLVVAYENPADPLHYLQVWDGFLRIRGGNTPTSATIDLTGIKTVASRTPNVTMGITAGDGDAEIDGDYLEVGPNAASLQRLSMPAPGGIATDNAFSSRIDTVSATGAGTNLTSRNPNPVNNLAYDARTIDITGKLPKGSTAMQVKIGTTRDALYPQVVWLISDALEPDLQIVKANDPVGNTADAPPGYVRKGDQVSYAFNVANKHPDGSVTDLDAATDVVLTDTLPTGVSYVAGSNPNCSAAGQLVTCTLPDLAPGASTGVAFKVTVGMSVADGAKLDNTGKVDFKGQLTGRPQDRESNTVRNTVTSPAYELTKTVDKSEAIPGDILEYTVTLRNTGSIPVTNLTVRDSLPPNTTYVSSTPSQGSAAGTGPIDWTVDPLAVRGTATLKIRVKVEEAAIGQTLVNRATVPTGPPPTIPPDAVCKDDPSAACASTTVPSPAYTVAKEADKTSASPGDTVTYTLTVTNTGRVNAANLTVTDDLTQVLDDADYQNDAAIDPAGRGSTSYAAPTLTWTGSLAAGQKATITYSVTVKRPNPGDHRLVNAVTSETPGGNCPAGSTDPKCTTSTPVSGLVIKKRADKKTVVPGDTVTYTITVTNTGQTRQDNATFTDDLTQVVDDADYQNDAAIDPAGRGSTSYTAPKLTWTGVLEIGESATITYTIKVKKPDTGDKTLNNVVTSDTPGTNCPPGSTDPNCSSMVPGPELTVRKIADKQSANPGDVVKYTVTVTNSGQIDLVGASAAKVTDDLTRVLDDADYQNDASAGPVAGTFTFTAPTLVWTGDLLIGQSTTLTYSVKVKNPITGDHELRNTVQTNQPGNCAPESGDPACTSVTPLPGIVIEKKVDKQSANPGDTVKYTVTVRNTGKTRLAGATVTDDVTKVLDDADYSGDASASPGTVGFTAPKLTWTGDLDIGATATITYGIKVKSPNLGDGTLTNVVTSTTPGGNCPPGSTDPKCTTSTPVSGLVIEKKADKKTVVPGDTVKYTVTVRNTGQTRSPGATFTDDLAKVLDDADYSGDASASPGTVGFTAPKLTWTGDLDIGASATITYSVKVKSPNPGDGTLTNVVTSTTPGGNCPPGSSDPRCSTDTPVTPGPKPPPNPVAPPVPSVAATGSPVLPLLLLAGALLLSGGIFVLVSRRRRTH